MKLRKDITRCIMHVEKPVMGVLQAHNLIKRNSKSLETAELTEEAKVALGIDEELVTDEWLKKWRSLWPTGQRGDPKTIRRKLNRFIQEEESDLEKIWKATEAWLNAASEDKFAGNANNFFYLQQKGNVLSRCREFLEVAEEQVKTDDLGNMEMLD